MKNKLKRFLLSVMAGVMVINAPLSVLAETTDVSTQGTDSVVVNNSDKSDVITDSSEENLTSKYTFKDVLNNDSTYDFLSNLNSSDRFLFLNELNQKEYYQLISLLKYDYVNSFSKKKKFDLYREVVKYYYSTFMNQIDEISNETLKEQYIEWDNELIQQINSECADVAKYEDSLVGSKDFDVKSLIDLFNEYFENFPSVMKQELTNEDKEKKLSEYVDKYFELQIETFGSKEDITYTFTENIYQMDVKGNEYELIDTQNREITCKLLKETDIIKDYKGFTFAYYTINDNGDQITEFDSDNIQSGETLNIYYNRNQYAVIANKDDGIKEITSNVDIDSALYYGTEVELTAEVEDGYTWKEWTDETGESISDGDESVYKFTVPVGGISLTATAQKKQTRMRARARSPIATASANAATGAKTVYVDGNYGNDSNTGTTSSPFRSLYRAYKELQSTGGTISFQQNVTFSGSVWLYDNYYADSSGNKVTLASGKHVQFVRYSGAGDGLKFVGISGKGNKIYTQGLVYNGYNYSGVSLGFIVAANGASIVATNCDFKNSNYNKKYGTEVAPSGYSSALYLDGSDGASCQVNGCSFTNNYSEGGSAVLVKNGSTEIINSTFSSNKGYVNSSGAIIKGGAPVELINSTTTITGCTFNNNEQVVAGAIQTFGTNSITIKDSSFTGNTATQSGGCIILTDGNQCTIQNTTFTNNWAGNNAGCIQSGAAAKLYIEKDCKFIGNTAGTVGGAIHAYGYLHINQRLKFEENKAGAGGAIYIEGTQEAFIDNSSFTKNEAGTGGAIYRTGKGVTNLYNLTFTENKARSAYSHYSNKNFLGNGGAIELNQAGQTTIYSGVFKNNIATGESGYSYGCGGAISAYLTNLSIQKYTGDLLFEGNSSDYCGGAINAYGSTTQVLGISDVPLKNNSSFHGGALYLSCRADIHGATEITGNTATYGGAIWNIGANTTIRSSTVIKGNTASTWGNAIGSTASSTLNFQGNIDIDKDNDVFLYDNAVITVNGAITNDNFLCTITPENYTIKKTLVTVSHDNKKASDDLFKSDKSSVRFQLTPKDTYTLRPGDYIDPAENVSSKDIIISTYYNVYFDKNTEDEVTNLPDTQQVYWREINALSDKKPSRDLYEFLEWNTQKDKSGTSYAPGASISLNSDLKVYAQWKSLGYKVKFHSNGGTGSMGDLTVLYGKDYTLPANTFTMEGYKFKDWLDKNRSTTWKDKGTINYTKNQTNNGVVDLYAEWRPIEYDIVYNSNKPAGASGTITGSTASSHHKYDESKNLTTNGYKLTGWTFTGWKDSDGNTYSNQQVVKNLTKEDGKKITLYAQWKPNTYTVKYNSNKPSNATAKVAGTTPNSNHTYDKASNLSSNGYSLTGWAFTGWKDSNGKTYTDKQSVKNLTSEPNGTVTLYAQWKPNSYTIRYDSNKPSIASGNITGTTANSTHSFDTAKNLTANGYKLTGWTFTGWKDSNGKTYTDKQSVKNLTTENGATIVLYAQWKPNSYTIRYDSNKPSTASGNITGTTANSTHSYDTAKNLTANGYKLTGWTFTGWKDSNGKTYTDKQSVKNLTSEPNGTVTLYAQWKPNSYTIRYDSNKPSIASGNITGTTANSTHSFDTAKNLTANGYKLTGWTFTGWKDSNGKTYTDKQSVKNLTTENGATIVLYAQWKPNTYTIHYDGNGATSGSTPDSNMTYDKPGTLNKNGFKKNNATFIGWKDETGKPYKDGQTVSNLTPNDKGVVKLIAQWDLAPEIKANDKTYYEGMTVTRADLLKDVVANDKEDGVITNKLIITKIEYSAGKLVNGKKQAAYTQEWANGMPADAKLDTWFMQLDKADSPVKHKVTYKVVDKVGNVTTKTVTVYVKYNNAPVITTIDRYYTLKEAQSGVISADELLKNSITNNKMKSTDIEEGNLSSKVELVDFNPSDFTKLTTSAVVTVTYRVHDSYGPNGVGKETINQFKVYITDPDRPPIRPDDPASIVKHVRFITKKYYDLNKDKKDKDLTDEEIAKANANGGLRVGCSWYSNPEYKSEITATFDKTSGTTYKFSHEDVEKIQEYINTNGIGNAKKANSLSAFYQKFLNK